MSRTLDPATPVLIAGAGGFVGGHLVAELRRRGFSHIRAVDSKIGPEWYQRFEDVENLELDLRERESCERATDGVVSVFNFACDMGGMGFIETHKAECMVSVLINTHLLLAAQGAGVERFMFASSACVYNHSKQSTPDVVALRETDVYPAMPEDGYGWEKLFGERMCRHFAEDYGLDVRIPRFHNIYGPCGTFHGGREKAPAAICRKVIEAIQSGSKAIEIWGDGEQTRSFTYIDDALEGIMLLMASDVSEPLNVGSGDLVTINRLVDIVESYAGIRLTRNYDLSAPQGVRGRNSDNTKIKELLGWEPTTTIESGIPATYDWIEQEVLQAREPTRPAAPSPQLREPVARPV